ncbi:UNKNOWN [Stylonychia lemnae]|uniref:Transmembrane protein n=1 Tax=Stylonychia lemnae TaxID=5949 RepID=A0A077ZUV3_STYLE|nr:UNKNOWN [Stylonychia lemnae]|eukprot:CDW73685.1 UNKNOWN [Stylonychia lemnae]
MNELLYMAVLYSNFSLSKYSTSISSIQNSQEILYYALILLLVTNQALVLFSFLSLLRNLCNRCFTKSYQEISELDKTVQIKPDHQQDNLDEMEFDQDNEKDGGKKVQIKIQNIEERDVGEEDFGDEEIKENTEEGKQGELNTDQKETRMYSTEESMLPSISLKFKNTSSTLLNLKRFEIIDDEFEGDQQKARNFNFNELDKDQNLINELLEDDQKESDRKLKKKKRNFKNKNKGNLIEIKDENNNNAFQ